MINIPSLCYEVSVDIVVLKWFDQYFKHLIVVVLLEVASYVDEEIL